MAVVAVWTYTHTSFMGGEWGCTAMQTGHMSRCTVHLHSLGREKSLFITILLVPSCLSNANSAHTMNASWRSPYTYTIHALIVENCREHAHASVCSALTDLVLQCPGVMPGLAWGWHLVPLSSLCLQGLNKPWPIMDYRLWKAKGLEDLSNYIPTVWPRVTKYAAIALVGRVFIQGVTCPHFKKAGHSTPKFFGCTPLLTPMPRAT